MSNYIGTYATVLFTDVWSDYDTFKADYDVNKFPKLMAETSNYNIETLYYLLYSRYGNSHINSFDLNKWKMKVFSIIFQNGALWQKKCELQDKVRNLTEDELLESSKSISNHSYNPSTVIEGGPNEDTGIIDTVNEQNTSYVKKAKIEGIAIQYDLLQGDITDTFLKKFKSCFLTIVEPQQPLLYESEE